MDKEYFVSINEVSKRLDVPAHTLRYWEKQFPTAIRPTTGAGGRRYYRNETVAKLETIKALLYDRGMTIAGVFYKVQSAEYKVQIYRLFLKKHRENW
jgi:DNA-binding transcriptional MerR regulator